MVAKKPEKKLNMEWLGCDLSEDFYKEAVEYLFEYYTSSRALQMALIKQIDKLCEDTEFVRNNIHLILDYQIESGKILYATSALIDKLLRIRGETNG